MPVTLMCPSVFVYRTVDITGHIRIRGVRSFKVGGQEWESGGRVPVGSMAEALLGVWGAALQKLTTLL